MGSARLGGNARWIASAGGDGVRRPGEDGEAAVALAARPDVDAACSLDNPLEQGIMASEGRPHRLRGLLPEGSAAFDVGEQECHVPPGSSTSSSALRLWLVEQVADGQAPARDDILGGERIVYAEDHHGLTGPMHRDDLPPGIDHEHDQRAVFEPLRDFFSTSV